MYGLLGEHLGHSFSKPIHESINSYTYNLIEKSPEEVKVMMEEKKFDAINVTIPYKQTVIPYLDEIDERARMIGSVNTVVNRNGKLYGYNTDFDGVLSLIERNRVEIKGKNVLILGTGGTSKTVQAVMEYLGAKSIQKVSRNGKDGAITYLDALNCKETEVIFNTTPCGMYPNVDDCPIDINGFEHLEAVLDAIYNPLRTRLIQSALDKGLKAEGGLYMLVSQAVVASEKFNGKKMNQNVLDQTFNALLKDKQNIVLTGMPGCGKSTVAKILSRSLKREMVDLDAEIEKSAGKEISEIFKESGEEGFRKMETEICKKFAAKTGLILSAGGGIILKKENIQALKQNGKIFFVQRKLENLQTGHGRPLSMDFEALKKRYDERIDIYRSTADVILTCSEDLYAKVKEIEENL